MNIDSPMYRKPKIFSLFSDLVAAESTRHGGVSNMPYSSLNLGGSTADSEENVLENNLRFFGSLNVQLESTAKSFQVHGCEILTVVKPGRYEGYDAMITSIPNIQLAVTIADCTPILIYDPVIKAVAAIHAGWRGTVQDIVFKTIRSLESEFGSKPANCYAYVGTCIDECSFEVGQEVAVNFDSGYKRWDSLKGKFFVDLKKANKDQLIKAGLIPDNIEVSDYSTVANNDDYFSYRLENGQTGRMLATIGMKQ